MKRSFSIVPLICLFGMGCSISTQMPGKARSGEEESISKKAVADDANWAENNAEGKSIDKKQEWARVEMACPPRQFEIIGHAARSGLWLPFFMQIR